LQAQQHLFTNEKIGDLIPSHECYNVFQDSKQYIWFSTEGGLCKYDGKKVTIYNAAKGFYEKSCYGICEDMRHTLWFVSSKNRLLYYDEKRDSICEAKFNGLLQKLFKTHFTEQLYFLQFQNDSSLLLCSQGLSLKVNVVTNKLEQFTSSKKNRYDFIKFSDRLFPVKYKDYEFRKSFELKNKITIRIIEKDTLSVDVPWTKNQMPQWRCNTAMDQHKNSYIGWDTKLIKVNKEGAAQVYETGKAILNVYIDKDGGLWVGTLKGGVLYFKKGELRNPIVSLMDMSISGVCEDHEKGVWCSTLERGIYYCKDKRVISYADLYGKNKNEELLKVIGDELYCYVNDEEILKMNHHEMTYAPIKLVGGYGISDIIPYQQGYLVVNKQYVVSVDHTLHKRSYLKEEGKKGFVGASQIGVSPNGRIFMIQLWAILELNAKGKIVFRVNCLPSGANCILARENDVLLGCRNGLYRCEYSTFKLTKVAGIEDVVTDIIETDKGDVFVSSKESGLYAYTNSRLTHVNFNSMFKDIRIFDLSWDKAGYIWAASNIGLMKINKAHPESLDVFTTENGLPSNQISKVAICNNEVYAATIDGLCSFDKSVDLKNNVSSSIYLKAVYVNTNSIAPKNLYVLPSDYGNIQFEFDALSFKENTGKTLYYTLNSEGNEKSVHETINATGISFGNLPPDHYILTVYALNNNGIKSAIPVVISLVVNKAFYQTVWFYAICGFSVLFFAYVTVKVIVGRIRRKEEAKTEINKKLAEYQLTALQAQMNPHFIFNAINSIQGYILKRNEQEAYNYLAKFSKLIRLVLNNSQEKLLPLKQELEMLELYVELEQLRFDKTFEFTIHIDDRVNEYEALIPTMLIQPYIENAIWHGLMNLEKDIRGQLKLDIVLNDDQLKITVEDNGIGRELAKTFARQTYHKSVGMNITEQRLSMINALQNFENAKVTVSDLFDESGRPAGTRVELYVPIMNDTDQ
jgi:hypothetical protein